MVSFLVSFLVSFACIPESISKQAPVVQWIECWIPVPMIGVRIPTGVQINKNKDNMREIGTMVIPENGAEAFELACKIDEQ